MPTLLLIIFMILSPATWAGDLLSKIYVDGVENGTMQAGQPSRWEFEFLDSETGKPPHHFHEMHQKQMHLVVISEDLENFAHIHPKKKFRSTKSFEITVNSEPRDADNFQLPRVAPFASRYFVYAEVMPMEYGMLTFAYNVTANSQAGSGGFDSGGLQSPMTRMYSPQPKAFMPRPTQTSTAITKWFDENGNEVSDKEQAYYNGELSIEPVEHCGVIVPKLNLNLTLKQQGSLQFQPVQDLETWLDSYGHALVIGRQGATAAEKVIQHLHAVWPLPTGDITQDERGPFIELLAHSHGFDTPTDRYRTWLQLKRDGRVLTLMFDFDWALERIAPLRILKKPC